MKDKMAVLAELARKQVAAESEVQQAKLRLALAEAAVEEVSTKLIPELMEELQLEEYVTSEGIGVKIKEDIRASVKEENRAKFLAWLRANGHARLIKPLLAVVPKDEKELAKLAKRLEKFNISDKSGVHPSTLSAFAREMLTNGRDLPEELSIFRQRVAKVRV